MKVDVPSPEDVAYVAANMRDRDREEFLAISWASNAEELAADLVARYSARPDTFCVYDGEEPVVLGAMVEQRPNVVTLMLCATDRLPRIGLAFTRFVKDRLFPSYRARGVHRIECAALANYTAIHRWIMALGLKEEAVMPGFGKGGETFIQFAWVRDESSPS